MPEAKHNQDERRKTFEELARDLECDESEERFEEKLRQIASKPPQPKSTEKR